MTFLSELKSQTRIEKSYEVTINNPLKRDYKDIPISIKIKDFNPKFRVRSAIVKYIDKEIP